MEPRVRISQPTFLGNEEAYVADVMRSRSLSMGMYVQRFESILAQRHAAKYAVAVTSGTTALHAALLALGVRPGDRVVVPACSYVATANAVRYCGAEPVFVDVRPDTWVLDDHTRWVNYRAVGVIAVHLYGVPCRLPNVPKGMWVLEDACEAHGVTLGGDAAVLSFYGNKIITCGEGGAVLTDRADVAERVKLLRGQGTTGAQRYVHETVGYNYRMTEMQAAIGCAQMEAFDQHLDLRRELMSVYRDNLSAPMQKRPEGSVDWVAPVLVSDPKLTAEKLAHAGIETRPTFPPLYDQPPYLHASQPKLPSTERISGKGLLLPLHLGMTEETVLEVCNALREAM